MLYSTAMAAKRVQLLPGLVNRRDADPGLLVELAGLGRCYLFDCGNLERQSKRSLMRVSRLFVSHTHIDHFIGFDRLLRMSLGDPREVHVYGPEGMLANLGGKFSGYLWNLQEAGPDFVGHEISGNRMLTQRFPGGRQFRPEEVREEAMGSDGLISSEEGVTVRCAPLEHRSTSLGYCVRTEPFPAIREGALEAMGLRDGPWLAQLKQAAAGGTAAGATLQAGDRAWPVAELLERLVETKPGQGIAYVTDTRHSAQTEAAVAALASGADVLYCEANFRDEDADRAQETCHLTAGQAARFARAAGVGKLVLFHISRKYSGDFKSSLEQARQVFARTE